VLWGPSRHLGSLTAANWVSFDFNVSYSSCWGYSLTNTLKLTKYTKWCVKSRRFSWNKFGKKRPCTFFVNWQFVWLNHPCPISWDTAFSREFACPIIHNLPRLCWIVSLSLHIEKSWHIISLFGSCDTWRQAKEICCRAPCAHLWLPALFIEREKHLHKPHHAFSLLRARVLFLSRTQSRFLSRSLAFLPSRSLAPSFSLSLTHSLSHTHTHFRSDHIDPDVPWFWLMCETSGTLSDSRLQSQKEFCFLHRWESVMMDSGGEARCNGVLMHAVVCSRLTCAHTPAHFGSWWHPPFGFQWYRQTSKWNLSPRRVCTHCTYCEQCACNRYLVCTLAYFGSLLLSRSLSLSVTLSLSLSSFLPVCRGGSQRVADARAHCADYEQCACSRDLLYKLAYVECLVSTCAHAVSCILYWSSGTSWYATPHGRVPVFW